MPPVAEHDCDVLVVGSGAAALTGALRLAIEGEKVVVLEKTGYLGGTSAMSGAGIWVPANPAMTAAGIEDDAAAALDYMRAVAPAGWQEAWDGHWRALAENGPGMIRFLEERTRLRFSMTTEPDPYPHAPGARTLGRMISVQPLSRWRLGRLAMRLRRSTLPEIFTYHEAVSLDLFHKPLRTIASRLPQLALRFAANAAGRGQSLMIGLIEACRRHGVEFRLESPAVELVTRQGRVIGARVGGGAPARIIARRGVLVASGGFEWNEALMAEHFPGPNGLIASSPGNTGDAIRMGAAIGAWLDNMQEATINPSLPARYEGRVQGVPLPYHTEPNSIIVDGSGTRFVDEQAFNIGVVLNARDSRTGLPAHGPAWVISDGDYLRQLPIVRWYLRAKPDWIETAPSLRELARRIGVPPDALERAVDELNSDCATGVDRHFGRRNDQAGTADKRKRLGIAPIRKPPFVALPVGRAFLGTKGGLRTDPEGRVLDTEARVIPGLYAAGAAAASPIGTRAISAGTTLGPYMTAGYICAGTLLASDTPPRNEGPR